MLSFFILYIKTVSDLSLFATVILSFQQNYVQQIFLSRDLSTIRFETTFAQATSFISEFAHFLQFFDYFFYC